MSGAGPTPGGNIPGVHKSVNAARRSACATLRERFDRPAEACSVHILKRGLIVLAACGSLMAQSGLNRPALGQMLDGQNSLRPVYGAGGSFQVEHPTAEGVLSSACAGMLCIAKTESSLLSGGTVTPAPAGHASIAVDTTGATIYFPSIQQFARWQNGSLTMLSWSVYGTVLSIGSGASGLMIAVERSGIVWIVAPDGSILDALPEGSGAVLPIPTGVVYATSSALILRKPDGSELNFPASGVTALFALGDGYVEASAGGILYALRTIAGREQLFQLPQPGMEPRR
jgi:hypothetical protein